MIPGVAEVGVTRCPGGVASCGGLLDDLRYLEGRERAVQHDGVAWAVSSVIP